MKLKQAIAGAVVLALASWAGPASATGNTYVVKVGTSVANTAYTLTASTTGTVQFALQRPFPYSTTSFGCTSANLTGTGSVVNGGTSGGSSPTNIATLPSANLVGCSVPVVGTVSAMSAGPMQLHGGSGVTAGATDVVKVHVEGVQLTFANAVCSFTVSGSARGIFNEATQVLTINETGFTGSLTYVLNSGCINQVSPTGKANVTFAMNLAAGGAINLLP